MTDIDTLAALLRGAAPSLAIGEFLEEAATALENFETQVGDLSDTITDVQDQLSEHGDILQLKAAAAEEFSAYLVSIGQPAVPVVCANPHLEALAELLLP